MATDTIVRAKVTAEEWRRLRGLALERGTTAGEIVGKLIRRELAADTRRKAAKAAAR